MRFYLDQLSWLRGVAAFLVICSHITRANEGDYLGHVNSKFNIFQYLDLGTFGVLLFFVLSGCTLSISYRRKVENFPQIAAFYTKRFFRIWPAFFISLLIYALFREVFQELYPSVSGNWIERQFLANTNLMDYVTYVTLTFNHIGNGGLFNNAYWSLPVEFQYYLLFPLLIYSLKYFSYFGPFLIGVILYFLPKAGLVNLDGKFFTLAYSFVFGVLLGDFYYNSRKKVVIKNIISTVLILIIFVANSLVTNDLLKIPDIVFISNKWNFYSVSAVIVTALLLFSNIKLPKKIANILNWMGEVSYSTYLYHNLFIAVAVLLVINYSLYEYQLEVISSFAFILTYIAAAYSYKYVELSGMSLGKTVSRKIYQ